MNIARVSIETSSLHLSDSLQEYYCGQDDAVPGSFGLTGLCLSAGTVISIYSLSRVSFAIKGEVLEQLSLTSLHSHKVWCRRS